jgi:hypothetical protein
MRGVNMPNQVLCAELWCERCRVEAPHLVQYTGPYVHLVMCVTCRHTITHDAAALRREFLRDLPARSHKLIRRNMLSARRHPRSFVVQLPRNLILKPLAIASELYQLLAQ